MAANPSIANPNVIPDTEEVLSECSEPRLKTLLERIEAALCRYFGEDEETIRHSLRGL
jgi:hypothetical protein